MTDPVSKLQAVGKETVSKLRDMQAAAAASLHAEDPEVLEEFTCQTRCIVTGTPLAHAYAHDVMLHPTHMQCQGYVTTLTVCMHQRDPCVVTYV